MATKQSEETLVQVATRVPSSLLATVKMWCIQHGVPLLHADRDFLPFARHRGLVTA